MALNMAANKKISEKKRYNVVALTSDGSNVRTWMLSFNNMLHMYQLNHMCTEPFAMFVRARDTLSININIRQQAERDIKQMRAEHPANDRIAGYIEVKTEDGVATRSRVKIQDEEASKEAKDTKVEVSAQVSARAQTRKKREDKRRKCALEKAKKSKVSKAQHTENGERTMESALTECRKLGMNDDLMLRLSPHPLEEEVTHNARGKVSRHKRTDTNEL
jgi:hypothetical protein